MQTSPAELPLNKYTILGELGKGGMADVLLAVVRGPGGFSKFQVIKRLRDELAQDPECLAMLLDEARLAARLNHPNVVQTNEVGEENGQYFICMEHLEGQPLHRVINRAAAQGTMPVNMYVRILIDVLAGLHYAHELCNFDGTPLRVVHRDVTPHNIFVTYEGQIKVVDFGIAKAALSSTETRTGIIKGKVPYMAPEQAAGAEVDQRTDIFSVGVMLWEAAVGARMWKGLSDVQILTQVINNRVPTARDANPNIHPTLEAICSRATALKPEDRYATALELQAALEGYLDEVGASIGPREISKFVSELFVKDQLHLKASIDARMNALLLSDGQAAVPIEVTLDFGRLASAALALGTASRTAEVGATMQSNFTPGALSAETPNEASLQGSSKPSSAQKDRTAMALVIAIVGVAALGATLAFTSYRGRANSSAMLEPEPAAATQSVVASSPPATLSNTVELILRATPAEARISLDGAPVEGNPFTGKFPKDGAQHRIQIEAPGFITQSRLITFDENKMLGLALERNPERATASHGPEKGRPPTTIRTGPGSPSSPATKHPGTEGGEHLDFSDPWSK